MKQQKKCSILSLSTPCLVFLGIAFSVGLFLGIVCNRFVSNEAHQQLAAYLHSYLSYISSETAESSFLAMCFVYLRFPLLIFIVGYFNGGAPLLPLLCAMEGFTLSFSVQCFCTSLGREGALSAVLLFGIRSLLVIPCTLYLGCLAWRRVNRRSAYTPQEYISLGLNVCILLFGAFLDGNLVPVLLLKLL